MDLEREQQTDSVASKKYGIHDNQTGVDVRSASKKSVYQRKLDSLFCLCVSNGHQDSARSNKDSQRKDQDQDQDV